ncbi:MAG: hypothetical protein H6688_01465 [Erysipelotrichaceae bacterium]|nr:hypothetical protein [Erysipelotrichaceae bacterium]
MYPEYNKVNDFIKTASLVMETSQRMSDIFSLIMTRNAKQTAVEYYNIKGQLKHYTYKKMKVNVISYSDILNYLLKDQPKHQPVGLKIRLSEINCA